MVEQNLHIGVNEQLIERAEINQTYQEKFVRIVEKLTLCSVVYIVICKLISLFLANGYKPSC